MRTQHVGRNIRRSFKRLFTHPYGPCSRDDCDAPVDDRWGHLCWAHQIEVVERLAQEREQHDFDRRADIVAEGIRRARL